MSTHDDLLPADFAHTPCGGWCLGECTGCCACGTAGCSGCQYDEPANGGTVSGIQPIGEDSCTLYVPPRTPAVDDHVTLEFDTSPETLQRLRDALRRSSSQP